MNKILFLLLFISSVAFSQDIKSLEKACIAISGKQIVQSTQASKFASHLTDVYDSGGIDGIDSVLESSDSSWYAGLDIYTFDDADAIIEAIHGDKNASFNKKELKKATIIVAFNGEDYLVFIFSYKA